MRNKGKIFEDRFKESVPHYCMIQRLNDPPQSFIESEGCKYSKTNPCDFFMFDDYGSVLFALELKSTKGNSISFEDISKDGSQPKKMIRKHQIIGLTKFSRFKNMVAGFVCNFRDEVKQEERTYFQNIIDFNSMTKTLGKFSFTEQDLMNNNAIAIEGIKKRVRYTWDVDGFLRRMFEQRNIDL